MIQYALHESAYLEAAKYYHEIWETPTVKVDAAGKGREVCRGPAAIHKSFDKSILQALEHVVYYIILAPHSNEQSDMLHRVSRYAELSKLELHRYETRSSLILHFCSLFLVI